MSNIPLAIGLGVLGAGVYGTSIVVQHRVVHSAPVKGVRGVLATLRNPTWLLAVAGDFIGFVLNVTALTQGPVVLIQPLVVLMLPVAVVVAWAMGGPRPGRLDLLATTAVVGGLACFLALVGKPHHPREGCGRHVAAAVRDCHTFVPGPARLALVAISVLGLAVLAYAVTFRRSPAIRGAVFGGVSGVCFGTLGVMINALAFRFEHLGLSGLFASARGWVPLLCALALGTSGMAFAMVSFQIGKLPAVLPVNLAFDPLSAVLFGSLVLKEHIPAGPGYVIGYGFCLGAVVLGAVRLAQGTDKPIAVRRGAGRDVSAGTGGPAQSAP